MITITVTSQGGYESTIPNLSIQLADNLLHAYTRDTEVVGLKVRSTDHSNFNYEAARQADGSWIKRSA